MQALSPLAGEVELSFSRCMSALPVVTAGVKTEIPTAVHGAYFCLAFFLHFRFDEIVKKSNVEYHAGGSTQNSVKIAQVGLVLPRLGIHLYACNSRFVRLAALGIQSAAAQHVDTLQF